MGVVARVDRKETLKFVAKLIARLEDKGLSVFLEPKLAERLQKKEAALPLERMKTDLIITVGGDGTILRTCLLIPMSEAPIFAINMGVRGFLAEVAPKEGLDALEQCLDGRFTLARAVFSAKSTIGIELLRLKRAVVVVNGHHKSRIKPTHPRMTITKSEHESAFVRFKDNFYHRLKGRLLFSRGENI